MNIGAKIKEIRTNLNLNQDEFATLINRSTSALKKYEADKNITVDLLENIADKLDISMLCFFTESRDLFKLFMEMHNFRDLSPSEIEKLEIEFNIFVEFLVNKYTT